VKDFLAGAELPRAVYVSKPYVIISREGVILAAGTIENFKKCVVVNSGYYNELTIKPRAYDLHLNDNTKIRKFDYWASLTMQKLYDARLTTKRECKSRLVAEFGMTETEAKATVKNW